MFKRLGLALLGILFATSVFAAADNKVIVENTTLSPATGMNATSDTVYLQDYKSKSYFVDYNESDAGGVMSALVTYQVSYDASNWINASFYDYAGNTTLQTSENLTTDSWYSFWPSTDITVPFSRINVACSNCTATNDTIISVYIAGEK